MYDKALLIVCVLLLICSNLFFMLKYLDYKSKYSANLWTKYVPNTQHDPTQTHYRRDGETLIIKLKDKGTVTLPKGLTTDEDVFKFSKGRIK